MKTETRTEFNRQLNMIGACSEGVDWVGNRTLEEVWRDADRADWMLWLVAKAGVDRKNLVTCCCAIVRKALKYIPLGEDRPRNMFQGEASPRTSGITV